MIVLPSTVISAVSDERPISSLMDFGRIIPLEFPIRTIEIFTTPPSNQAYEEVNINNVITGA